MGTPMTYRLACVCYVLRSLIHDRPDRRGPRPPKPLSSALILHVRRSLLLPRRKPPRPKSFFEPGSPPVSRPAPLGATAVGRPQGIAELQTPPVLRRCGRPSVPGPPRSTDRRSSPGDRQPRPQSTPRGQDRLLGIL